MEIPDVRNSFSPEFWDRWSRLKQDGMQFLNDQSPHDVAVYVDIPAVLLNRSYGEVCEAIREKIEFRLRISHFKDAGCLPQKDKVRLRLIYQLKDLEGSEETHTTKMVYQRISAVLESQIHQTEGYRRYANGCMWSHLFAPLLIQEWTQDQDLNIQQKLRREYDETIDPYITDVEE